MAPWHTASIVAAALSTCIFPWFLTKARYYLLAWAACALLFLIIRFHFHQAFKNLASKISYSNTYGCVALKTALKISIPSAFHYILKREALAMPGTVLWVLLLTLSKTYLPSDDIGTSVGFVNESLKKLIAIFISYIHKSPPAELAFASVLLLLGLYSAFAPSPEENAAPDLPPVDAPGNIYHEEERLEHPLLSSEE